MMFDALLRDNLTDILSSFRQEEVTIYSFRSIAGGCINYTIQLDTNHGNFFVKFNNATLYPGMFEREAEGLALLAATDVIRIPDVIGLGTSEEQGFLILEYIQSTFRSSNFCENFGRSIAELHRHTSDQFGLDKDNYIGSLPQYNEPRATWKQFFIEQRLQKQVEIAFDKGAIQKSHVSQFEQLYQNINGTFPEEPPALLHGDLWSGNYMVDDEGQACIMDPAVYYGHREAEIAFTQLFGGFSDEFYGAYQEAYPLQPGFDKRKDLYNLYPLMVHVNLFGGGYLSSVESILRTFA